MRFHLILGCLIQFSVILFFHLSFSCDQLWLYLHNCKPDGEMRSKKVNELWMVLDSEDVNNMDVNRSSPKEKILALHGCKDMDGDYFSYKCLYE